MRTFGRDEDGGASIVFTLGLIIPVLLTAGFLVYVQGYIEARNLASSLAVTTAQAAAGQTRVISDVRTGEQVLSVDCYLAQAESSRTWALGRERILTSSGLLLIEPDASWSIDLVPVGGKFGCQGTVTQVQVEVTDTYRGNEYTQWLNWTTDFTVVGRATVVPNTGPS